MAPRDPELRSFRIALWAIYLTVVGLAIGLAVRSIVKELRAPHHPSTARVLPTRAIARVCVAELEALHKEQNERSWGPGNEAAEKDAVARWRAWSRAWERRLFDLGDRCQLDAEGTEGYPGRRELSTARDAVLAVHRSNVSRVNRYAQEDVGLARAAASALGQARAAAAAPEPR